MSSLRDSRSGEDARAQRLDEIIREIAANYESRFPDEIASPRIVGREAEFPVVDASGASADVRRLWDWLIHNGDFVEKTDPANPNLIVALEGEDYSYALEVGLGTIEVNTRPCPDLHSIERITHEAVRKLVQATAQQGWRVLGYGIQPITSPSLRIMSPKQRYQSLYRAMGQEWLWYTVTASDQIQIDIARHEALQMLNFGNLMSPVIIAFCANSPVYGGRRSEFNSGREGEMALIHANEHRHGMPASPYESFEDYVRRTVDIQHLILQSDGEVIPSSHTFADSLLATGVDMDLFLYHEHYIWNSARTRVAYGTIEIRPACQQPWESHMAASALGLGLIEAAERIEAYVRQSLGDSYWDIMRDYRYRTVRRGLLASEPAPDFLHNILSMAERALQRRGLGEDIYLQPLWTRLYRNLNPARHIRRVFRTTGIQGVIERSTIRPVDVAPLPDIDGAHRFSSR